MSLYKVPFDFTHEEKVFGGYLSLRQMLYLIISIISIGILFLQISIIIKTILFLTVLTILIVFAFVKIGNTYADKHFLNIIKYMFRKKIFTFER